MTGSAPTTLDPRPAQLWQAARGPVVVLLLVLAAGLVLATVAGGRAAGYLDPRAADPAGSRAVAELLRDQGVRVDLVRTAAAMRATTRPGDTLVVTAPELLVDSQVRDVRATGADLVLAASTTPGRFAAGVEATGTSDRQVRSAGCSLPAARRAGDADSGGLSYSVAGTVGSPADGCYSSDGAPSLVRVTGAEGAAVTFVGNPEIFTNDRLDDEGNAALALGLLGQNDRLVWYLPTPGDVPVSAQRSLYDLVPDRVWWALAQLVLAVVVLALWRARRLGPVVAEPLPVVVRASETTEGRARLYRRAGARGKAAEALRADALGRLVTGLGLPRRSQAAAVIEAVAGRTGRPGAEVAALLYGSAPPDDAALVRLARALDDVEKEVRRS